MSFEGPHEGEWHFYDSPMDFLVPNVPDPDISLFSGLDFDAAKDALVFVLSGSEAREYRPLTDYPALFQEFAQLDPTQDGISVFAERWGALGSETTCEIIRVADDGVELEKYGRIWGELIELWEHESGKMHDAVALWDAARRGKKDILEKSIWFDGDTVNWRSVPDGWSVSMDDVSSPLYHPERFEQIARYGLTRAAQYIVQDLVNEGLDARVHEQLQWDELTERSMIRIVPKNLIGALWLQLASAIEGDRDYSQCTECSIWFEIAPSSGRPDKIYCSDACRMRAYRKRKKAAKK